MARTRQIRTGPKPRYVWVPGRDVENTTSSGTSVTTDLLATYASDAARSTGPGMVIERILLTMIVESQTVGTGGDFTAGLLLAPEGGFLSTPQPETEINDYLVYIMGLFPSGVNEQAAGVFQADQAVYMADVKSRRRLRSMGDQVLGIVRNSNSTSMLWTIKTRILLRVT